MKRILALYLLVVLLFYPAGTLNALPQNPSVESGQASFSYPNENTLEVRTDDATVINFGSFGIAANELVNFIQPSLTSNVLCRAGGGVSEIHGTLAANGNFFLVNPSGVYISSSAQVQANTLILSTLDINTNNFLNRNYVFERDGQNGYAQVLNEGRLSANNIALLASAVSNSGDSAVIAARVGSVSLASGDKVTISFDQKGLIQVVVNKETSGQPLDKNGNAVENAVNNSGSIEGATVLMNAQTAGNIFQSAVNTSGVVRATGLVEVDGVIRVISNEDIQVSGELRAQVVQAPDKPHAVEARSSKSLRIAEKLKSWGKTILAAFKHIAVQADITTHSGDLELLADNDFDGTGSFTQAAGTTISTVTSGDITIQASGSDSTLANINSAGSLMLKQGGASVVFSQHPGSRIVTAGSLQLHPGVTLNALDTSYEIGKDWLNLGIFNPGFSRVSLVSAETASVMGNNTFYDFSVTVPGKIVKFDTENTLAITGTLTFKGAYGKLLVLASVDPGKQWSINPLGQTDIQYALIHDSINIRGPPLKATYSDSAGNLTNWDVDPFWTGEGASNYWSDPDNWDTGTVPISTSIVTFDGITGLNPNKDSIIDASFQGTIASLTIDGFSGTLTLERDLTITGDIALNSGSIIAETTDALTIETQSGNIYVGQSVLISAVNLALIANQNIDIYGTIQGNTIVLNSLNGNTILYPGSLIDVSTNEAGATGGRVEILGWQVLLIGAQINASGLSGGGTVLIGGDFQGQGTVPNATNVFISKDSYIYADALAQGDGGRVIVWADGANQYFGNISACGGIEGGNGGFIQVYGAGYFLFNGLVEATAPNGSRGTFIIDPESTSGYATTLSTDLRDYQPGETVTITGSNWQPGETVSLVLHPCTDTLQDIIFTAVADANGNFSDSSFTPQEAHLGVTFKLTATGASSGITAETTFTDTTYTAAATGSWGTSATWGVGSGYPGSAAGDTAGIIAAYTVTLNLSPANAILALTIGHASAIVQLGNSSTTRVLSVSVDVSNVGTIRPYTSGTHTLNIGRDFINFGTFTSTRTNGRISVNYNGAGAQSVAAVNYYNLTFSGAHTTNSITLPSSGTIGIAGTFSPSATFTSGGYIITGSTIDFNGTGAQTITAFNYNNLTISGARTTNSVTFTSFGTIGIAATFSPTATFTSGGYVITDSTVDFNGTGAQTITAFNYNNLTISGEHNDDITLASSGTIGIAGTFSPAATFTSGGYVITDSTIDFNGTGSAGSQTIPAFDFNNLTISGEHYNDIILASSGTIGIAGTFSPTATFTSGGYIIDGSTIEFNGSGSQTIPAFNYYNLVINGSAGSTVAFDAVGPSDGNGAGGEDPSSPVTWEHTCTGADLVLFVGIAVGVRDSHSDSDFVITEVTYNDVPLQQIGSNVHSNDDDVGYVSIWYLAGPATGTHTVSVSFTNANSDEEDAIECGSVSFSGVNQSTPYQNADDATGAGASPSVAITSSVGNMVVDIVTSGYGISSSGQTLRWLKNVNGASGGGNGAQSTAAGAASVTMSYTVTPDYWAIIGLDVVVASGTRTVTLASSGTIGIAGTFSPSEENTYTVTGSTVDFNGTGAQALDTEFTFYNLVISNNSGSSASDNERTGFVPSVDFNVPITVTNDYTITTADVRVEYESGETYTFNNIEWEGTASHLIYFRNSAITGTWLLKVTGTQTAVSYVNVSRSDASVSGGDPIDATDGTNYNAGNNINWLWPVINIYYSVGQNTNDNSEGGNVYIDDGVAYFDTPQTDGAIGVGDKLIAGGVTYYLASKISTTEWNVVTAQGATPTDAGSTAVTSITHCGDSLELMINAAQYYAVAEATLGTTDLVTGNYVLNISCYNDSGPDTTPVFVGGWTTDANRYVKIYTPYNTATECNQSQRHMGIANTGFSIVPTGSLSATATILDISETGTVIDGLEISENYSAAAAYAIRGIGSTTGSPTNVTIKNCLVHDFTHSTDSYRGIGFSGNGTIYYNNIVYNFTGNTNARGIQAVAWASGVTLYVFNNTAYNIATQGIHSETGPAGSGAVIITENNIAMANGTDFYWYAESGTTITSNNNMSSDSSASTQGGSGHLTGQVTADQFVSISVGSEDLHLMAGSDAINAGKSESGTFTVDINHRARPAGAQWDIGADEYTLRNLYFSVGQSEDNLMTGSPTIIILDGVAIFSEAQTGNIGVGDIIIYENALSESALIFISGKISTTQWNVVTLTGDKPFDTPGALTAEGIERSFGSLSDAVSTIAGGFFPNLLAGYVLNFPCYYDSGPDTTAVTISGVTTGPDNYIHIYTPNNTSTEVNISQRHTGKWDNEKYALQITNGTAITDSADFLKIDGLQISLISSDSSSHYAIITSDIQSGAVIDISNNILKGTITGTGENRGISMSFYNTGTRTWNVWNNIIYGFNNPSHATYNIGIQGNTGDSTDNAYVYNNTVYGNYYGIAQSSRTVIKNNIAYDNAVDYMYSSAAAGSTNNLSKDNTCPDYGTYYRNASVQFEDAANGNFHLSPLDTAAKNHGVDLSGDSYLDFTTDIDGKTRPNQGAWDIGADEAALAVYYSAGASSGSDLTTGSPDISISDSVATFSQPQTDNIGVGDIVFYNPASISGFADGGAGTVIVTTSSSHDYSNGDFVYIDSASYEGFYAISNVTSNTFKITHVDAGTETGSADTICFIAGKNSTTSWNVVNNLGGLVPDVSDKTVAWLTRTFGSLSDALANAPGPDLLQDGDLVSADTILNIPCYYDDAPDTDGVIIEGFTTSPDNYIKIYTPYNTATEVNVSQRHMGVWDDEKYSMQLSTDENPIRIAVANVIIDGLQIKTTTYATSSYGIMFYSGYDGLITNVTIKNNIITDGYPAASASIGIWTDAGVRNPNYFYNNIIYGFSGESNAGMWIQGDFGIRSYSFVYNNTVYNCTTGLGGESLTLKNNIAQGCTDGFNAWSSTVGHDYNISDVVGDTTDYSPSYRPGEITTVSFVSTTPGSEDLHLASTDTYARDQGTSLNPDPDGYLSFSTDINNRSRPYNSVWDIGADEYTLRNLYFSVGLSTENLMAGSPTIAISNGVATFSEAQTGNIGVGDVIVFNDNDNPEGWVFISGKISTTQWNVVTVLGDTPFDTPTDVTVNAIAHFYNSLADAVTELNDYYPNLLAGYVLNLPCYYDSGYGADTDALTVDGYITGPDNYIHIYTPYNTATECNVSQRHMGVADEEKYYLEYAGSNPVIEIGADYTRIDGLQIVLTGSGDSWPYGIFVGIDNTNSDIRISNNIIVGAYSVSNYGRGITGYSACDSTVRIWNNIIYGFTAGSGGTDIAIRAHSDTGVTKTWYIYNNTIYNSELGISQDGSLTTFLAKNNLIVSCSTAAAGNFANGTDYNATDNVSMGYSVSGGGNDHDKTSIDTDELFVDTTPGDEDLHLTALATTDVRALGYNATGDSNLAFSTDINNRARPASGNTWCKGADEYTLRNIYFSVGQDDETNLMTGTPTITISNGVATFSTAQTGNIGVGDVIEYDGGTQYAIISAKISATTWSVFTGYGDMPFNTPTGLSVNSIMRVFNSLSDAVSICSTIFPNLLAGYVLNLPCYYDNGPDTAPVYVDDVTTGPDNYIHIYTPYNTATEVNQSQRHEGVLDTSKYYLSGNNAGIFIIGVNYVWIDGLQIIHIADSSANSGIGAEWHYGPNEIKISNNIIKGVISGTNGSTGIGTGGAGTYTTNGKIWNNIIYGFDTGSNGYGISSYTYAYNNTVYGCYVGIASQGSSLIAKNNISYNNQNNYIYTFSDDSSNNLSSSDDAPGDNPVNYADLDFVSTTPDSEDFHLIATDTDAIEQGIGLNPDPDGHLSFSTDINRRLRPYDSDWDIGADEYTLRNVYFSVGQDSSTNLMTGTPTISISNGVATFSLAQTGNIGVGDIISYDNDTQVVLISAKASTTTWSVISLEGDVPFNTPTSLTVNSIMRNYSSLSNAVTALATYFPNLLAGYVLNLPCYYDNGPDTTAVTVTGFTTGADNYIKIYTPYNTATEANYSQRHEGAWDDEKYNMIVDLGGANAGAIHIQADYVKIDGIQIAITGTSYPGCIYGESMNSDNLIEVSNCLLTATSGFTGNLFGIRSNDSDANWKIWNNIFYNFRYPGDTEPPYTIALLLRYSSTAYIYNNTFFNNRAPFALHPTDGGTAVLKNNLFVNNYYDLTGNTLAFGTDYNATDQSSLGYTVSGGGNDNDKTSISTTNLFVSTTPGSEDLHLTASSTTDVRGLGYNATEDSNLAFTTDIDADTRPASGNTWCKGADEYTVSILLYIYYSVGQDQGEENNLMSDESDITITNGLATFSESQSGNIGVGDTVTFGATTVYISGKLSTSQWYVVTAKGETPGNVSSPVSITSITRTFYSLADAITGAYGESYMDTNNLVNANYILNIACYYDNGADTDPVTITGYTTGPNNYIKIYTPYNTATEVNYPQRHMGAWDDEKYNLSLTNDDAIIVGVTYLRVEGLQISVTASSGGYGAINCNSLAGPGEIQISQNIFQAAASYNDSYQAISDWSASNLTFKIWNNIFLDWRYDTSGNVTALYLYNPATSNYYIYNNTFHNCGTQYAQGAIHMNSSSGYVAIKNNLFYQNGQDGSGTADLRDYNATDASSFGFLDSDGSNDRKEQVFAFVDAGSHDFHLASTDTGARDHGTSLNPDPDDYLSFSTDINNRSRPYNSVWDIGADEYTLRNVYFSVGQDNPNLLTGSPTISILDGVATFSVPQTGNIGVGDFIYYDNNVENIAAILVISGKISATQWNVATFYGDVPFNTPTSLPVDAIARTLPSLSMAVTVLLDYFPNLLAGYVLNLPCYYDTGPDTDPVTIDGYTTGVDNYINIYTPYNTATECNISQRHAGVWDDSKYNIEAAAPLTIDDDNVRIEGIQVANSGGQYTKGIIIYNPGARINNNIIKYTGSSDEIEGIDARASSYVWNNVVYGFIAGTGSNRGIMIEASGTSYLYNNTVYNCSVGIFVTGQTAIAKNNLIVSCTTAASGTFANGTDYNATNNGSMGYSVSGGGNDNDKTSISTTNLFLSTTGGSEDLHLTALATTDVRALGYNATADGNLAFSTDINNRTRPSSGNTWCKGADEYTLRQVYASVGQDTSTNNMTGTPTITISNGVATFSTAQTGNIGVGDIIDYDANELLVISGRTSSTVWSVVTLSGDLPFNSPTSLTVNSIKRFYSSLSDAITDFANNVPNLLSGYVLNLPCYYDNGPDTTAITITGFTTSATNYINIYTPYNTATEVNVSQRHSGVWDEAKYRMDGGTAGAPFQPLRIEVEFSRVEGLQFGSNVEDRPADWYNDVVTWFPTTDDGTLHFSNNIVRIYGTPDILLTHATGLWSIQNNAAPTGTPKSYVWNNIFINEAVYSGTKIGYGIFQEHRAHDLYAYNNTFIGWDRGYHLTSGEGRVAYLKNNLFSGNTAATYGMDAANCDYNATDLADIGYTASAHDRESQTFTFVSTIPGSEDFHLKTTDTGAIAQGTDLSNDDYLQFTTDIHGQVRLGSWDIGADQVGAYWVTGGTGDWSSATNWSPVAGGVAVQTVPVATTAVFLGVNSGTGTATVDSAGSAFNLDCTGFTGTLVLSAGLSIYGDLTLVSGMTFTPNTQTVTFTATSGTQTLASGSKSFYAITHSGAGTLQLLANALALTNNFTNAAGTFDLNGQDFSVAGTVSNAGTLQLRGDEEVTFNLGVNDTDSGTWEYVGRNVAEEIELKDFGTNDYFNLIVNDENTNKATFVLANSLKALGALSVLSGTLSLEGNSLSVTGTVNNDATIQLQGNEALTLFSGNDVSAGTWEYVGRNIAESITIKDFGSTDYYNLKINDTNTNKATFTLGSALSIAGTLTVASGTLSQGSYAITSFGYSQSGGQFSGGSAAMTVNGAATITDGLMLSPSGPALTVVSMAITAPGIVRLNTNGRLVLTGTGTPLSGTGTLDLSTYTPNSVEYTGQGTTDIATAGPLSSYYNLLIIPNGLAYDGVNTFTSGGESYLRCAVVDTANGFAYFGEDALPGRIVKVRLSDMASVGVLTLNQGEDSLLSATIDTTNGFAYFGTYTSPGKVIKIQLSDFTRNAALTLEAGEDYLSSAVMDSSAGFCYFGTDTSAGKVIKIQLSDFTRNAVLALAGGEDRLLSGVIDAANHYAYFGTYTGQGKIIRADLSTFGTYSVLSLSSEGSLSCATIDTQAGYAYFGTDTAPGTIVKVRLSDFTRNAAFTLGSGEDSLYSAAFAGSYAYFGTYTSPGKIIRADLSSFGQYSTLSLLSGDDYPACAVIDAGNGYAYFGTVTSPGKVLKIQLSDFSRNSAVSLSGDESFLSSAVIDTDAGYAYFGTDSVPGVVIKMRLSDFTRIGALTLSPGENYLTSAVIDAGAGFAYFGTATNPGIIVKVNLSNLSRSDAFTLASGENRLRCAVIDTSGATDYAYFGTTTAPGKVIRANLSSFGTYNVLDLNSGENYLSSAVIDTGAGYAYFGTNTSPGRVVKIKLSDFTRNAALTLESGENSLASAVIDTAAGYAYFGTFTNPGIVVKVALAALTRSAALTLNSGENGLTSAVIDTNNGFAFFGTNTARGMVVKVKLSDLTRLTSITTLNAGEDYLCCAVVDMAATEAYFGTYTAPGRVIKVIFGTPVFQISSGTLTVIDLTIGLAQVNASIFNPVINVNGNFVIQLGGYFTASGSSLLTVSGDWSNQGTFTHSSGTVDLGNSSQDISGSTTFFNLLKTITSAATLTFEAGSTQIIAGTFTLTGASNNLLSLRSSTPTSQWNLNVLGSYFLDYLDVQDSISLGGTISATHSHDSDRNTGWSISE